MTLIYEELCVSLFEGEHFLVIFESDNRSKPLPQGKYRLPLYKALKLSLSHALISIKGKLRFLLFCIKSHLFIIDFWWKFCDHIDTISFYHLTIIDISLILRKTYLDLISSWSNFDAAIEIDCIYSHHRIQHQQTSNQTRLYKIAISKYFATFLRGRWYGGYNCCRYTAASKIMLRVSRGCSFCLLIFHLFTRRKLHKTHNIINVLWYYCKITHNSTKYIYDIS